MSEGDLSGRLVMITGATSGLGEACARNFSARGARVAIAGRDTETGEAVAAGIRASGGEARFFHLDVTQVEAWPRAIAAIESGLGPIQAFLSNVGKCNLGPIRSMDPEHLRFMLRINTLNSFLALKFGIPALRRAGGGSFVAISSVAALKASEGGAAYAASKAAIGDLVRAAARECRGQSPFVQVNAVYPGLIWSENNAKVLGVEGARRMYDRVVGATPLRRPADAEDIIGTIRFLLSRASPALSGAPFVVDGGFSA